LLANHIGKNLSQQYTSQSITDIKLRTALKPLQEIRGEGLDVFPQNSILRVTDVSGQANYFTLINNSGYSNISELLGDLKRRRPSEDYLTVVPGIIGAYPNAFFKVTTQTLPDFMTRMKSMKTEADYNALADLYAVRRTNPRFWDYSDALHAYYKKAEPVAAGMLDYNRFENR
jgi:hypothetical protein